MMQDTIGGLIRQQGQLGERMFLVIDDQRICYGDAEARSRRIARR